MNNLNLFGWILVLVGVVLPFIGYTVPSPLTYFVTGHTETSTSYLWFPFINYITIAGAALVVFAMFRKEKRGNKQ